MTLALFYLRKQLLPHPAANTLLCTFVRHCTVFPVRHVHAALVTRAGHAEPRYAQTSVSWRGEEKKKGIRGERNRNRNMNWEGSALTCTGCCLRSAFLLMRVTRQPNLCQPAKLSEVQASTWQWLVVTTLPPAAKKWNILKTVVLIL